MEFFLAKITLNENDRGVSPERYQGNVIRNVNFLVDTSDFIPGTRLNETNLSEERVGKGIQLCQ